MIALGVRQPWAELILRCIKTIEVRSTETTIRGPIYIYASKKLADILAAETAARKYDLNPDALPKGVVVGTVEIVDCTPCRARDAAAACVPRQYLKKRFAWHLEKSKRLEELLTVRFLPYGVWFYPWKRRNNEK
jgi:hypothetical protein